MVFWFKFNKLRNCSNESQQGHYSSSHGTMQSRARTHRVRIHRVVKPFVKPNPRCLKIARLSLGVALTALTVTGGFFVGLRYGDHLTDLPFQTEPIQGQKWVGDSISFEQQKDYQFDISFRLDDGQHPSQLMLKNIDLSQFIPKAPLTAKDNPSLTRWFLSEREFNRQRVIFSADSEHVQLPEEFAHYTPANLSIALTNNCLGAGHWELAILNQTSEGESEKIYQGYFTFPRGAYANLVSQLNHTAYWQQARAMEAWQGFHFLSGMAFDLDSLRRVNYEQRVPISDLSWEPIITENEQLKKADLIVYADDRSNEEIKTWADLRKSDLNFQSFVSPGIYDSKRLWASDFSQISTVKGAIAREISSPLSEKKLTEVEIEFANLQGDARKFIISGLDFEALPQLETRHYSDGLYMPLGFGTPFTQNYSELVANPPDENPLFSVWLDEDNQVIDYRQDIGINGIVLHRDLYDRTKLHVYIMSYERITLIGHYVLALTRPI